ncbi:Conserved_hypothetical protein [Hexamita inflata]|uniref:Uncharacterized protein n=1 Tax=Hexamita inflata TaxID=28002 RepID=A0AA86UU43_9EUKA|nr:Conserved hypothetical protein [Hexamita inflata]
MVVLSLVTFLRIYSLLDNIKGDDVWKNDCETLATRNGKKVNYLTPFDSTWLEEVIVSLAQLLRLCTKYDTIHLTALGSFLNEAYFSVLRALSGNDNSVDKAEQIIRNKEVLQFCEEELGQEYSSTKISRHRTQVMVDVKPLDQSDLQSIEEVSWAMISFIEGTYNKKDKASKQHAEQNKQIIMSFIEQNYLRQDIKENFWPTNEDKVVHKQNTLNTTNGKRLGIIMHNTNLKNETNLK